MKNFKILLVSVFWEKPNKVKQIIKSKKELKANVHVDKTYEYDIVMYEKSENDYYQFCIQTNYTPIIKQNGKFLKQNILYKINDNLWIIKGDWELNNKGVGYHECPSINTAGEFEIGLTKNFQSFNENIKIHVHPNITNFSYKELLNDFEGELWNLLTLNNSKITAKKDEKVYNEKSYALASTQLIVDFLTTFKKIVKNPKEALKYTAEPKPIEKVKPIPETYKKMAQFGLSKNLPSKSFSKNLDIYENRLICYMLYKLNQIASNNSKFTGKLIEHLRNNIQTNKDKIKTLKNNQTLDKNELIEDIKNLQKKYKKNKLYWEQLNAKLITFKKYNESNFTLYISSSTTLNEDYCFGQINHQFSRIKFPSNNLNIKTIYDKELVAHGHLVKHSATYKTNTRKHIPIYFMGTSKN